MSGRYEILDRQVVDGILERAWELLARVGVWIEDPAHLDWMAREGLRVDREAGRVFFERASAEELVEGAPSSFVLHGRDDPEGMRVGDGVSRFDPGSAAVHWLEPGTAEHRLATAADCRTLATLTEAMDAFALQATGVVPSDAPPALGDCLRLYWALVCCRKPVVTGTFRRESFAVMERMLRIVSDKPLAVFDCCPSPPLKWTGLTLAALFDCARSGIPAELVSMPLAGATAPVTLEGAVVQQTAENLSGVVLHQLAGPGAPIVWGGSPAAFDMRYGTTPMGAMDTMLIDLGASLVGRRLGLPTHAYMACSDAKLPDYQAGMESGIGAVLAVAGGVDIVSGPGFLNYENTQSPEKLILDAEACRLAARLARGIEPRGEVDPVEVIARRAADGRFLRDPTTARFHRRELMRAGPTVSREPLETWAAAGGLHARDRARAELARILADPPPRLDQDRTEALGRILLEEARSLGCEQELRPLLATG